MKKERRSNEDVEKLVMKARQLVANGMGSKKAAKEAGIHYSTYHKYQTKLGHVIPKTQVTIHEPEIKTRKPYTHKPKSQANCASS